MSRCDGRRPLTTSSPIVIVPEVSSSRPAMQRSVVVLPQPDGPSMTNSSPSPISRSSSSTATVPSGNALCRLLTRTSAISAAPPRASRRRRGACAPGTRTPAPGSAKTIAEAATSPQSIVVPPIRPAIADGAVRVSGSVIRKIENTNSFQEKISANTAVAAMPGISSGIVTRQKASKRE